MVSFILSTTFSDTNSPFNRFSSMPMAKSLFSIFIHQKTKSTRVLYIYSILERRPKVLLKMFLINADRLTLPRRPQHVIFEQVFENAVLYCCFCNSDYSKKYSCVGKHVEGKSFYIYIVCVERRPKRTYEKCP